jgi:rare lipoprotein A
LKPIDYSGRTESGKASYYAVKFEGRKMADGDRLDQSDNVAASKTLPIGTTAKVTNLETGKSVTVKIEDRGPHIAGRSIDVSSSVANKLDINKSGVAPVEVKPITVPQRDGGIKLGAGAAMASGDEVRDAVRTTPDLAQ